jgi:hypothetical protein
MKTKNLVKMWNPISLRKLAKPVALCISVLFIISMLSFYATTSVQARTVTQWRQQPHPTPTPTPKPIATPTPTPKPTSTPTPAPTPTSSGNNLVPIPNAWTYSYTGMSNGIGGLACDTLDSSTLFNGQPTLKINCALAPVVNLGYGNIIDPEMDSYYTSLSPGDHIVFSCWVKSTAATMSEGYNGGSMIIDFYGADGRICGTCSPTGAMISSSGVYSSDWSANEISFGTSSWTYIVMDFIVPSQCIADPFGSAYTPGTLVTPIGIIPKLYINANVGEGATFWFADTELYVNPSG